MKYFIAISIALLSLSACNQDHLIKANLEIDSLQNLLQQRETSIDEFMASFNDVEKNLDSVAFKQQVISMNTHMYSELKRNQKSHINKEINAINSLMEQNRIRIAELTKKWNSSTKKNTQLQKTIALLNTQLVNKYVELTTLNERLSALNKEVAKLQTTVDALMVQNGKQADAIANEIAIIHTAYYIVGKSAELQDAKLIDKKGGLLGIGRTAKLNENVDNNKFTRIDYTKTTSIRINSTDAKIISTHPSDSYMFEKDKKLIRKLLITNPEKFWSVSKYLVITYS